MYLILVTAALVAAWRHRPAIGRVMAKLAAPFEARPVRLDAEILGVQLPEQVDWSFYDAPAYLRRSV